MSCDFHLSFGNQSIYKRRRNIKLIWLLLVMGVWIDWYKEDLIIFCKPWRVSIRCCCIQNILFLIIRLKQLNHGWYNCVRKLFTSFSWINSQLIVSTYIMQLIFFIFNNICTTDRLPLFDHLTIPLLLKHQNLTWTKRKKFHFPIII